MHLRHPGFRNSACGPFTKYKERIQKFTETRDSRYIYQNKLNKAFFQHNFLMEILQIYLEEQRLIKYYVIKHIILLNIQVMMGINKKYFNGL